MVGHIPEVIAIVLLLVFAATMFYHGWNIIHEKRGYSRRNYMKWESENIRKRMEKIIKDYGSN